MVQYASTNEEMVVVPYQPLTAAGNPAEVETVTVEVTSGTMTAEVDTAEKKIRLISGSDGPWGLSTFTITMDADLGEGVTNISEDGEYFVTQAQASSLGLGSGEVVLK